MIHKRDLRFIIAEHYDEIIKQLIEFRKIAKQLAETDTFFVPIYRMMNNILLYPQRYGKKQFEYILLVLHDIIALFYKMDIEIGEAEDIIKKVSDSVMENITNQFGGF